MLMMRERFVSPEVAQRLVPEARLMATVALNNIAARTKPTICQCCNEKGHIAREDVGRRNARKTVTSRRTQSTRMLVTSVVWASTWASLEMDETVAPCNKGWHVAVLAVDAPRFGRYTAVFQHHLSTLMACPRQTLVSKTHVVCLIMIGS